MAKNQPLTLPLKKPLKNKKSLLTNMSKDFWKDAETVES